MNKPLGKLEFNTAPATKLHIDLNSCFATIEQQANPLLRDRPIAVAAYNSPRGVILAPSVQAKKYGIRTGMRVMDGKKLYPNLIVLEPDADKYRHVHHKLKNILLRYTDDVHAKSVDEFVLNFEGAPLYKNHTSNDIMLAGADIKHKIKQEIGEYITVSIGVSKNGFLAKTAAGLKKPDGLEEISEHNYLDCFSRLKLIDLCGIGYKSEERLNAAGIMSVLDFYNSSALYLKQTFGSIFGYYWYIKLRGYEIDDYIPTRKSVGHQYALPKPAKNLAELRPVLIKLVEKMGFRLRGYGFKAQGISLFLYFNDRTHWHKSKKTTTILFDSQDFYQELVALYLESPKKPVKLISVTCFNLKKSGIYQLELFKDTLKHEKLVTHIDNINKRWGKFVIAPASIMSKEKYVPDRIGFGNV